MILPTKYLDLDSSVLRVSAVVLRAMADGRATPFDEVDAAVRERAGSEARLNLVPALNFLFLAGKVDYDEDADAFVSLVDVDGAPT